MKNNETVKDKRRFNEIIHNKNFIKNKHFVIYIMKKEQEKPFFGVAVSKKIKKAVMRNKLKRQARMLIDQNKFLFQKYHDYIIIIKEVCLEYKYQELNDSFKKLFKEKVSK